MQNQLTNNLLVWDDFLNLPIPDEVKPLIKDIDFNKYEWGVSGLPGENSCYSVSGGKTLYLSEDSDGNIMSRKQDQFTGDAFLFSIFINKQENSNEDFNHYLVCFKVVFLKGESQSIELFKLNKLDAKIFNENSERIQKTVMKNIKFKNSVFYKYLYFPWKVIIWALYYYLFKIIGRLCGFLTPFE